MSCVKLERKNAFRNAREGERERQGGKEALKAGRTQAQKSSSKNFEHSFPCMSVVLLSEAEEQPTGRETVGDIFDRRVRSLVLYQILDP